MCLMKTFYIGTFPSFISSLVNLRFLALAQNSFQPFMLSPSMSSLKALNTLLLYKLNTYGTIPSAWGTMTNLRLIRLDGNLLTGCLRYPQFHEVVSLFICFYCNVSGPVPPFVCTIKSLLSVRIESNLLTGSIPSCWQQNIQDISLFNNSLTGL